MKAIRVVASLVLVMVLTASSMSGETLNLAGPWRLRLDPDDQGQIANWPALPLVTTDEITLPTTTDLAGFGFPLDTNTMQYEVPFPATTRFPGVADPIRADEHGYLVRRHLYVGPAWYEREIDIPQAWENQPVTLRIERALWKTQLWLDGERIGECDSLVAEHRYPLGALVPGRHRLTICVDNRLIHNISTVTHAYGPETQSRWNGMIGRLQLEAAAPVSIESLAVFPAADRQSVRAALLLTNSRDQAVNGTIQVHLFAEHGQKPLAATSAEYHCPPGQTECSVTLGLEQPAQAWDEFQPTRYRVNATLDGNNGPAEEASVLFGFRHVERIGNRLLLNGRPIFLRGTLDCAVYPNTGHPPMTVAEWERVLGVVKLYGFNHVRFHTWCPPDAAFEAADRLGLYLQPETSAWVDDWITNTVTQPPAIGRDPEVTEFLRAELWRMSEAYGNHPSFLLCAIGNEFGMRSTDWDRVNELVQEIKQVDPRRLYAGCGARKNLPADDFWFTHNSGSSTRGVGPAHTDWDFAKALETSPVPLIAHETGQRPVFPDYETLLPKFTGPLLPLNLDRYRSSLHASGLADQMKPFVRASARFQLTQYKGEHEAMLRTRGYSGYQLLMLNDFTGQSEALVGVLDPFWETKGVVGVDEVRAWNAPTAVLARLAKFVWMSDETLQAQLEVAHFGPSELPPQSVRWTLCDREGDEVAGGTLDGPVVPAGDVTKLGSIATPLKGIEGPAALTLKVLLGDVENCWHVWVYPASVSSEPPPDGVLVTQSLDEAACQALEQGGRVLLLAHGVKNPYAARTGFESVYWSAGWWGNKFSSLGLLCDPHHPALAEFPNDGVSDWQWHELCAGATTFDLTGAPAAFRPIVQSVPDFHFNTLLAHVFEAHVGKGSLLVCGYDLTNRLESRPAARQFRRSLLRYAGSDAFRPSSSLSLTWLTSRCAAAGLARRGVQVTRVSSEDRAGGNVAGNILDGDPATFWHTRWQPRNDPMPHELLIDLGRPLPVQRITFLPRQDQSNGRIAAGSIFACRDADDPGTEVAELQGSDSADLITVDLQRPVTTRFLRLMVESEVNGQPFASLAELDVVIAE